MHVHNSSDWTHDHVFHSGNAAAVVFINKGVNGRWSETLGVEDSVEYENKAISELGAECASWLAHGAIT